MRHFQSASGFDTPQDLKQFRRCDLANRPVPEPWKDISFQPLNDRRGVIRNPILREFLEPLSRYGLEPARLAHCQSQFFSFSLCAGIYAGRYLLARFIAARASVREADFGVCTESQKLFLTPKAILKPPPLTPGWSDHQIKAEAVE